MSARLLALWLVTIPAFAGRPDYNAFSDAQGHIGTPEQVAAAQDMVRAPGQLEIVFAEAAKGNLRAARVFQELVVDPQSKTVLHWLFKPAPKAAP